MSEFLSIKEQLDRIESSLLSQKRVLTIDEVSKFTGLSKSFLYKLSALKILPHYKPNGKVIFIDRTELESFLLQNPIKTSTEIDQESTSYVTLNNKKGGAK